MVSDNSSPFQRLFIALAVPPEIRVEIGRVQGRLRRDAPPGAIRWTRQEQFHVTLKFLGDIPSAQLAALEPAVYQACAGRPALRLSARGIGCFPNEQRPRGIWIRANDPDGQLAELRQRLDEAMRPFAPMAKPEKFTGHITLGRFKPGRHAAIEKLLERATVLRDRHFGDWTAVTVEIVRSELSSTGARHTPLASCPLAC